MWLIKMCGQVCVRLLSLRDNLDADQFSRFFFFFKQKTAYEMRISDWSSDVCSSDLWTVDTTADCSFTLYSASADRYLTTDPNDATLVLASDQGLAGKFRFVPASGCEAFPEIGLDAIGTTYKGQGIDKPVLGFADVHSHMSATTFLGGAHYGAPFSRFGVTEAMGNCAAQHGPKIGRAHV